MDKQKLEMINEARESLVRIQDYDVTQLPRSEELGTAMSFEQAVEPAKRLINLYKQLPVEVLDSLATSMINQIKDAANRDFNVFQQVLNFTAETGISQRDGIIKQIEQAYDKTFNVLHPMISYSVRKTTDFAKLEDDARSKLQSIEDKSNALEESMERHKESAAKILADIKKVAEEQGVSQQAYYFRNEANKHTKASYYWLAITVILTIGLIVTAVKFLGWNVELNQNASNETYAIVQLTVSKILVFATLSFLLALSAKNYMANKHNEVINRHRENALKTYEALVDAAGDNANRDIVLKNASECIFMFQTTGFGKADSSDGKALSMLNIAPAALRHITED